VLKADGDGEDSILMLIDNEGITDTFRETFFGQEMRCRCGTMLFVVRSGMRFLSGGASMVDEERRKFLGICLGGVAATAVVAVGYPVYRYLAPLHRENSAGKVVIPEQEVPAGGAKFFEYAGSTAVLVRKQGGDLVALSAVCTHLGCIVQWQKEKQDFLCPCHAGHYSLEGAVISGPPPKPLAKLPFTVANGAITVG
jgi:cytochrome b6-f complex iron-sulfur subunit